MAMFLKLIALILDLASWVYPLALLGFSGFLTTSIIAHISPGVNTSAAGIFVIFPLFYILWITIFVILAAIGTSILFYSFKKPAKVTAKLENLTFESFLSCLTIFRILTLYRMSFVIRGLPLLNYPQLSPALLRWINKLVLRTYAPSIHVGKQASLVSRPQDPDLTFIGNHVVIGSECSLVAHAITTSHNGQITFSSAPIEISDFAVIGGGSYIAPGVKVGEGAIIQMRSNLQAFSRVGPREVWGGNPAVFQRMVSSTGQNLNEPASNNSPVSLEQSISTKSSVPKTYSFSNDYFQDLEKQKEKNQVEEEELDTAVSNIISKAIYLKPEEITDALNSDNCISWDSMAQMSMASTIYDQFGVDIAPENIFQLRSRQAVKQILLGSKGIVPIAKEPVLSVSSALPLTKKVEIQEEQVGQTQFKLPGDPELLPLSEIEKVTEALARKGAYLANSSPRRVLFVSTFTLQMLKSPLELWCQAFKIPVEANFLEFDQIEQTLLSEVSEFSANSEGLNIVLTRPEDLISERDGSGLVRGQQLMKAIQAFSMRQSGLVVCNLPPLISVFASAKRLEVEQLRVWWQKELEQIEGVQVLDFAGVVEEVGRQAARDTSMEVIARAPYSQLAYRQLGIAIARLIRKTFLPSKKVIALDCDNTLWGGVVGEDGIDGLALSDDYPGRSFRLFQKYLLEYRQRGILLVLVSKNEESDVWQVFDQHPEMLIRRSDIAGHRINWQSKSENLYSLAKELNLGLDSFVFVDDSPTERLEVETNSPEVTVVPMPTDAARYVETFSKLWCFDTASLTAEDKKRTEYMLQQQERQSLQQETSSLESYLEALDLVVNIRFATNRDLPRVAQLTQKTNQFNLSLIRRSLSEIQQLKQTHQILVMNVADRFGEYGLVGLAILAVDCPNLVLDTFLMSCRVLGRGVEDAFLSIISRVALEKGISYISAPYQSGSRNSQIKEFLIRNGFSEKSPTTFSAEASEIAKIPKHIKVDFDLLN